MHRCQAFAHKNQPREKKPRPAKRGEGEELKKTETKEKLKL